MTREARASGEGGSAPPPSGGIASRVGLTAASQAASMAIGALLAVLILLRFGKNARTDGLLAAYGAYGVILTVAQSLRVTVVARLVEGSLLASFNRYIGAMGLLALAGAIPLVLLGDPLARLLTGDLGADARSAARTAFVLFWLAGSAQLIGALGAATLGALGEFGLPALAYVAGGLLSVGGLLALSGPLEIDSVGVGVAAGALLTAALILSRLAALGYRPRLRALRPTGGTLDAIGRILAGSFAYVLTQLLYVVSVAFAARLGEGGVTLYSYAFFAQSLLMGITAGPVAMVLAAPLSRSWDRDPRSLEPPMLAITRTGFVLVLPLLAVAAIAGDDIVELVLGASLDSSDADTLVATFLALSGLTVASVIAAVPIIAAFAKSQYARFAALAAMGGVVHLGATTIAFEIDGLAGLGVAASIGILATTASLFWLVFGRRSATTLLALGRELLPVSLLAVATFGPPGAIAALLDHPLADALAAVAGAAGFALSIRAVLPGHWELARTIVRNLVPRRRVAGSGPEPDYTSPLRARDS